MSVQLNQPKYCMRESRREYPPFLIAVTLIESEHMINNAQPPHLAADGLRHPGAEAISIAERSQVRYELSWGVLELDKDGQKDPLLLAIAGEEKRCKVFEEIGETDHVHPEGDDEGPAGSPMARERPRAGKCP